MQWHRCDDAVQELRILIGGFRATKQRAAYCGKLAEAVVMSVCGNVTL